MAVEERGRQVTERARSALAEAATRLEAAEFQAEQLSGKVRIPSKVDESVPHTLDVNLEIVCQSTRLETAEFHAEQLSGKVRVPFKVDEFVPHTLNSNVGIV